MKIISKISFGHELFFSSFQLYSHRDYFFFCPQKKTVKNKTFIKPFYNSLNATFESPEFQIAAKTIFFVVEFMNDIHFVRR